MSFPTVTASEVATLARRVFPSAKIDHETISPADASWRIQIGGRGDVRWLEIMWEPLSGFGATDVKNLPADDPDIFAPYEVALGSLGEAKRWLEAKARAEANQRANPTSVPAPRSAGNHSED